MVSCQQNKPIPARASTVIIGNGPSALFLSFLLHGNVPYYKNDALHKHDDVILHRKLSETRNAPLYQSLRDVARLCEHFEASGRYSSDAWPVNVLVDALMNTNLDTDWDATSSIVFHKDAEFVHSHVVLGSAPASGGQWGETIGHGEGENARTLSYSEQLSLPGYSFSQFFHEEYGREFGAYERPRRPQISAYYAQYPARVGIQTTLWNGSRVSSVRRVSDGNYHVSGRGANGRPFAIECENVVLACGLFTHLIEPSLVLSPIAGITRRQRSESVPDDTPILIVGSGFSAADAVIENLGKRLVIHLYKWQTAQYTSPLKHCHRSSYPEYADVYHRMKLSSQSDVEFADYIGLADSSVIAVKEYQNNLYNVVLVSDLTGASHAVTAGEIAVLAGRQRTNLDFLEPAILNGLCIDSADGWLEKSGLRDQIAPIGPALTVDQGRILCIGSITGDSLIRFMFGAAMGAASCLYKS